MQTFFKGWWLVFLSGILDSLAIIFVKKGLNKIGKIPLEDAGQFFSFIIEFLKNPVSLIGVIFYISSPILWFFALSRLDVSKSYPVLVSIHLLLSTLLAIMLLDEKLTYLKGIGIFMILTGALLLFNKHA